MASGDREEFGSGAGGVTDPPAAASQAKSALGQNTDSNDEPSASQLFSRNLQATVTYCSVFWSFGMCVALLGPTIEDLGCQTESTLADMSWAFLAQSMCTLIGSMIGGILVDRLPADPMLLVSTIMIAVTIATIPLCSSLSLLLANMGVMGIFMGIIDTIANVSLLKIYGRKVSPFLQALHFCYGLGAFISPIVAEPFLLNHDCSNEVAPNSTSADVIYPVVRDLPVSTMATLTSTELSLEEAQKETRVKYAFWIMAAIQLPIIVLVLMLFCKNNCVDPLRGRGSSKLLNRALYEDLDHKEPKKEKTFADQHSSSSLRSVLVIVLLCAILFLYDGLQAGYGGFIFAYAVRNSHILVSASDGAYMTSVFWGSFALGRLLSIPISTRCSLPLMLLCNLVGCFAAMSLEVTFHNSLSALYIASALFGISLSSIYPTSVALAEHNLNMTGFVTSCLVIAAASGEMVFPVFIGRVLFPIWPYAFLQFSLFICVIGVVFYIFLALMTCGRGRAHESNKDVPVAENVIVWCGRNCCLTQSRESLIPGESNYYTTLSDSQDAYAIVESPEQIAMGKMDPELNGNAPVQGE